MKYKTLILAIIFGLFISSIAFSQNETIIDRDPNAKSEPIPSDDLFDLIFEYPCAIGGGEAGIETDGQFFYTTKWSGNQFYKYSMTGSFIDSLTITGVSSIRDLAYDGTYFYGGAASTTVYELDLSNATLISTFTAPTNVRAIAYDEDDDVFYANNWGSAITIFDNTGTNLGSWSVGPVGDSYYGFAYDNYCGNGPLLWGYAQVGVNQNELVQLSLPDIVETGVYFDVGAVVNVGLTGIAGGLCVDHIGGDVLIIGMSQNEVIWGLELCPGCGPCDNDVGINAITEPSSGVGGYTNDEPVVVEIKNFGFNSQSDIIVSFVYNGSPPYFDTAFTTINMNETFEHTFDTTVDMTVVNTHMFESCTYLVGDEDPFNDCKTKTISVPLFGTLEGYVTNCLNGDPLGGAMVECGAYMAYAGADGSYAFQLPLGTYDIFCGYTGFCPFDTTITLTQTSSWELDIELCPAQFEIYPDTVNLSAAPGSTIYFSLSLSNPGDCDVDYTFEGDVSWLNQGIVTGGTLAAGESLDVDFPIFDISLAPGLYVGHVIFESGAITSPDTVTVILEVLGFSPPVNLSGYYDCTDICLTWEIPSGGNPLYFNIYRDGELLVSNFTDPEFCDENVYPEVEYCYQVSAVYENGESEPTPEYCITVPIPEDLEPMNPTCTSYYSANVINWDEPEACLEPDGYNLYRNDTLIETFPATTLGHYDPIYYPGIYEYTISAIYYFGESDAVLADCITGIDEKNTDRIEIYPNPVHSRLIIKSDMHLNFIEVFNNIGIQIQSIELTGTKSLIDMSEYIPGIYHLKITTQESDIYYRKIIVE